MAKIVTIACQKGGTSKTTTVCSLAQAAAFKGFNVLVVDADPQANTTYVMRADANKQGMYSLLTGTPAKELIQHCDDIDVIPSNWSLSTLDGKLGSARKLANTLAPIKEMYDFIFIDTPPTLGILQYNALFAADEIIIPLQADVYCIQSLYQMIDTVRQMKKKTALRGYILTQFNQRSVINRQAAEAIEKVAAENNVPFMGSVRTAVAVKEAAAVRQSLYVYAAKCKPAFDYMEIFNQISQ